MSTGEDWLLRPVLKGMCKYESLKNGDLDLYDVANMNDALDVDEANRATVQKWVNKNGE